MSKHLELHAVAKMDIPFRPDTALPASTCLIRTDIQSDELNERMGIHAGWVMDEMRKRGYNVTEYEISISFHVPGKVHPSVKR